MSRRCGSAFFIFHRWPLRSSTSAGPSAAPWRCSAPRHRGLPACPPHQWTRTRISSEAAWTPSAATATRSPIPPRTHHTTLPLTPPLPPPPPTPTPRTTPHPRPGPLLARSTTVPVVNPAGRRRRTANGAAAVAVTTKPTGRVLVVVVVVEAAPSVTILGEVATAAWWYAWVAPCPRCASGLASAVSAARRR